ncbi:MAG: NAD(P)/FAD-dependent oxidoreductase [Fuerstiella sp.]|nr:NAD(P)/FAD-dependent oxidoreductase [Fuerstiella sp.]MCP4855000.1 NAD(P)/FAD-dependent oxidoreductase [Fuerstiella sp.]
MSRITRRDFVNGTLMAAGATMLPNRTQAANVLDAKDPSYYPPSRTGLRGSHPGSNTYAHAMALDGDTDFGPATTLNEEYDLVVVGGGISGLAAAYYYQQKHGQDKKVLILENHDDFGGHARRNEHTIDGKLRIGYGGTQTLVDPQHWGKVGQDLLDDLGIDLSRWDTAYDLDFFKRHNLGAVMYFNKQVFGEDKVVRHPYSNHYNYIQGCMGAKISNEEAAREAPVSEKGKEQLLRILNGGYHVIKKVHNLTDAELRQFTRTHSYYDYLKDTLGVGDPLVIRMARMSALDWGSLGTDMMGIRGADGAGAMGFPPRPVYDPDNPYIHHFPGGNAGFTRAFVKRMIPDVAVGNNAEELVMAAFHYDELDKAGNAVRIRLNSTVVNVHHEGDPANASEVSVTYMNNNKAYRVRAKGVVMACYNVIIPYICSDLPEEQAAALKLQTKSPLQYTSVGLKNWRAFKELEIGVAMSPGNMHQNAMMDFPVSMGGYEYTRSPEDPCIIQMVHCPYGEEGAPEEEQYSEARYAMLNLQFQDYEDEIRSHLSGMLPKDLFNFDRDVASISVNRWAHGYANGGPGDSTKIGRQPFHRITVANSDSAPGADSWVAVEMAIRAVNELG